MANTVGTKPSQLAPAAGADDHADEFFSDSPPVKIASAQPAAPVQAGMPAADDHADEFFGEAPQAAAPTPEAAPEQPGLLGKSLDAAGRVLDYGGGLVRSGLAEVAGLAEGKTDVVTPKDLVAAFKGKAPNSAEYLTRLGLPELGSVDVPLLGKVTGRGVTGFVADIVTDPLVAISKLAKEVPYLRKAISVTPGLATEALGEAVYKSSLSKIDAKVAEKAGMAGATPVADTLLAAGAPVGGTEKLAKKVDDISQTMGKLRQGLYDKADRKSVV